jgi:hypothetical protein
MNTDSVNSVESDATDGVSTTRPPTEVKSRGRHFSMSVVNLCLDAVLLGLFTVYGWVLGVLRFVFPAPSSAGGWSLWGWNFDQWWDFQFNVLCTFAVAVLIHVMLHWNWVCAVLANQILHLRKRPDDSMQTIYGVGTLIALLHLIAFGIIAAMYGIHRPPT